jgi:hypothetical protein
VSDPVALIRLQAPLTLTPAKRSGPASFDRQAEFFSQDKDESAQKMAKALVLMGKCHDFQRAAIVSQPYTRPIGQGAQQPAIGAPVNAIKHQALLRRWKNGGHR